MEKRERIGGNIIKEETEIQAYEWDIPKTSFEKSSWQAKAPCS